MKYSIVTSIISSIFLLTHHNELPVEDLVYTNSPFLFIESLSFTKPTSKDPLFPPIPDGSLFQYPLSPSLRYFNISLELEIEEEVNRLIFPVFIIPFNHPEYLIIAIH